MEEGGAWRAEGRWGTHHGLRVGLGDLDERGRMLKLQSSCSEHFAGLLGKTVSLAWVETPHFKLSKTKTVHSVGQFTHQAEGPPLGKVDLN